MATSDEEFKLHDLGYKYVCGIDEAGMGCLAGDVFAAAVVFPAYFDFYKNIPGLNDSKKLTHEKRCSLYDKIKEHAITYCVSTASVEEINIHNIYWARFIAARRAISQLKVEPDYILVDGNAKVPKIDINQKAIVKGDSKSFSIAAASILAKVDRDRYMDELSREVHEDYGWATNKAYWTHDHVSALEKHGKTKWHRERFIRKIEVKNER